MRYQENKRFIFDGEKKYGLGFFVNYLKAFGENLFLKTFFYFKSPIKYNKNYRFSILSIFKNEAPYLKEFIEYHMLIGFEHFYLYNNNSEDNYQEVLKDYVDKGIVTLVEWPVVPGQQAMYEHWYKEYRRESSWVSFLDLDEFICPLKVTKISEWIKPFEKYPEIMFYWKMFGSNGKYEHDNSKMVTEQYINSWSKISEIGKIIYNTDYDIPQFSKGMMHGFKVKYGWFQIPPINIFGYFVDYNIHRYSMKDISIQVNHYWSKAYACYLKKHQRGSAVFGKSWKTFDQFLWHEHFNVSSDYSIYRFLMQLKLKMDGRYPQSE
jgi:hypothetical protein